MGYDQFFIQPGDWRILLNCLTPLPDDIGAHRLVGVEKVNAYQDAGDIVALVWQCKERDLAYAQAEALWSMHVPARVISTPHEEFEFLRHILSVRNR